MKRVVIEGTSQKMVCFQFVYTIVSYVFYYGVGGGSVSSMIFSRGRNPIVRLKDYLIERVRFPPGGRGVKKFAFPWFAVAHAKATLLWFAVLCVKATFPLTLPPPKGESKRVSSLSTLLALLVINAQNLRAKDFASRVKTKYKILNYKL